MLSGSTAPNAYPLTSAIAMDLCARGGPAGPALQLARYLVTQGQAILPRLGYGALPARVRLAVRAALDRGGPAATAPTVTPTMSAPTISPIIVPTQSVVAHTPTAAPSQ